MRQFNINLFDNDSKNKFNFSLLNHDLSYPNQVLRDKCFFAFLATIIKCIEIYAL